MKKRSIIFAAAALLVGAVHAFHCQFGISGYSNYDADWCGHTIDVGASANRLSYWNAAKYGEPDYGNEYYYVYLTEKKSDGTWKRGAYLTFLPGGGLTMRASTESADYDTLYGSKNFTAAELVNLGTFGYNNGWIDYSYANSVVTVRGDPFSVILNDTDKDRIINGVKIKSGECASLPFPVYLVTDEIENAKFYDLESGIEITPHDFASSGDSGRYYSSKGYYAPNWTGNIRITDGTTPRHEITNIDQIVYADMDAIRKDYPIYATNNMPIYAGTVVVNTNIQLMTWWDFDLDDWGGSPQAMINGEVVCGAHSTTHIISYTINANELRVSEMSGKGYCYFTMSQIPQSGYSGGACTMRCWDTKAGGGTSGYAAASDDHKAEVSAGLGIARFKLTVNIRTGKWKVEPN